MSKLISVMVVDDHSLMRAGISGAINAQSDMRVVAEACDGAEGVDCFKEHLPDVTLMDIRMPKLGGIEAITAIRRIRPGARIIVLTTAAGDMQALRAFKEGAAAYLLKNMLRLDLVETIRIVHQGRRRIPDEVAAQLAEHATDDQMTPRELDVLSDVAKGCSNKVIAQDLDISEHTVKNHVRNILSKLGANDRTHAVMIALKRGILDV